MNDTERVILAIVTGVIITISFMIIGYFSLKLIAMSAIG